MRLSPHHRPPILVAGFFRWFLAIAVAAVAAFVPARAQSERPTEYQVKAAFLYNFTKFIEWPQDSPADNRTPIVLGILGDDPFGSVLEKTVYGKTVNGRPLEVRRFRQVQEVKGCQILFISASEDKRLPGILQTLRGSSVLTVGETKGFTRLGGIIRFILEDNRVRFEINLSAAQRARLKISSKLLAVAYVVRDEPDAGKD